MNANRIYITPDQYEIAESNGISRRALEVRLRHHGWPLKKALRTPTQRRKPIKYPEKARQHGVSRTLYRERIRRHGWAPERAATTPPMNRTDVGNRQRERCIKYDQSYILLAESNGIPRWAFYNRMRSGWTKDRAATEPLHQNGKKKE